ncbi:exocyst complex component 3-like protein 4 isoform X1 [Takifugu flavidus]|uniref:exocyst complex component 3-like protein 4 isoform X1 n=1 Tax=Takifugu flavidus TaxID=433684 RepID=UPI002544AB66|nr:exocyst complex component 3-like protein 4 isoform X1 [Takifugu flavidus]XP_056915310.1 exocyst complex component 3-like protein 4 isoform X1 [Takifugu flavidus]XP_056915311.1 exocyst complex component 3-like protein 4 isoform X1 [Takifugu flavidus]XP_056915312.1 exocyst complex component 3-like protein 4 isoform X1 [Takifugu flavidus]
MMEASEEPDRSSPGSNAVVKEMLGGLRASMRSSFRRVAEKNPLSPTSKGSKVTPKGDESGPPPPPSPSPSWSSSLTSPLKNAGGFFIKKEEDDGELTPQTRKGLTHSKTDPNLGSIGDTLMKKVASGRRSLRFSSKKDKNKGTKQELVPVVEGPVEKKTKESEDEEEEKVPEEVEEAYVLPDIPHIPLSVMQISKLIETEVLEEAHLNLLALRREFQQEQRCCGEDSPMELAKKEKDLSLLYGDLRNKIKAIVRDSNSLPSRNKGLLVHVARIIQEEERRAEEPGGPPGSWMDFWREAVGEGVQAKVGGVSLMQKEQNASWLAVHLGLLGKAIVEDLESVRKELRWFYPPSFKVFHTYVNSYHRAVGQHLRTLEQPTTELKDLFALLDWIINQYQSERIMGSTSLQPDMNGESKELQLEDGLLEQLQDKYCCRVKEEMRSSLDRIIELQDEELWGDGKAPEVEDDFLSSEIHMDIWTFVKGKIQSTGQIDAQLKMKVVRSCMEELKPFPKRFEARMQQCCSELRPQHLWTQYHITYINSFIVLQQHVDECRDVDACPDQVSGFKEEVKWLIEKLLQELEDQFKEDVKPYLRRMMTRKWMSNDEDFAKLHSRIDSLAEHCSLMRPGPAQEFASRLHYHVVREYIGQLMKSNYSCKSRKHEKAAAKIRDQWEDLRALFKDMRSTHEWLHDVGEDLSDIIGQKNKRDIKTHLQPVVEHYPDFSRKHLVAVLYFRGLVRGREYQLILQKLTELKKQRGSSNTRRVLFATIPATVNTDCLSNLPFSCLSLLS